MKYSVRAITLFVLAANALSEECENIYSDCDCQFAKNDGTFLDKTTSPDGDCFMFSKECQKTCGCDYDPAKDRALYGLDDSYYEDENFECAGPEDEWEDSWHYNCTVYEGARWCMVNEAGETVEGPGWCNWLGPDTDKCNIPKGVRWPKFEYAVKGGKWAKSCCCNTGLAETYPYEEDSPNFGGDCVDKLGRSGAVWNDGNAYSCRSYHYGSFCRMDGTPGTGWTASFGDLSDYTWDGLDPLEACCSCGGGDWRTTSSPADTTWPSEYFTPSPTTTTPAPTEYTTPSPTEYKTPYPTMDCTPYPASSDISAEVRLGCGETNNVIEEK